jgi:sodium pump decarboxylase gamma subunit
MLFNLSDIRALSLFNTDPQTLTMMWQTVVLGMGMIFSVLGLLWAILAIFKLVFVGKAPKEPKAKPTPAAVEQKPAASVAPAANVASAQDDGALIAVITAAVAAYIADSGEQVPAGGFRVVSFARVRGGKPWNSK